jgi:hypothetical protein
MLKGGEESLLLPLLHLFPVEQGHLFQELPCFLILFYPAAHLWLPILGDEELAHMSLVAGHQVEGDMLLALGALTV